MRRVRSSTGLLTYFGMFVLSCSTVSGNQPELYREQPQTLYREGQPAVLAAPPSPEAPISAPVEVPSAWVRDNFRKAYQSAGAPRLAVFWNREFSDVLRDMEADEQLVIEGTSAQSKGGAGKSYLERELDRLEVKVEVRRDEVSRDSPVTEIGEFRFQTGYLQPLIREGAKVIDRSTVMRITDAQNRLADNAVPLDDRQLVETSALQEHADLLIQIALVPSAESIIGAFFHISVIDLQTGRIRASFFHDGIFPPPPKEQTKVWKAAAGGYVLVMQEKEPDAPAVDLEIMGRILSEATMIALAGNQ